MQFLTPWPSGVGVNARGKKFGGLGCGVNEWGSSVFPPVSRPLNVLIELDNLLGDGQDVLGPVVSVDLRSLGGEKWPDHSGVSAPLKRPW